ncbi:MAG TPA: bi-domain-containing oxidoreductase, partial [Candidatus Eisenbacteria bacterium]|nr:bi-domain-containing oxidoreductase [Candidatus Eisenbacteria bacterium]
MHDVPDGTVTAGHVQVAVHYSAISPGTEGAKRSLAAKPLWEKAMERPDQVAKVLDSVRSEGFGAALSKVQERLALPQVLGYSLAGRVVTTTPGCEEFPVGKAVACGGVTACHAESVVIPKNLVVPIPPGVSLKDASFATIGAIALHGIRSGQVAIGDRVLVIGLGLIGQLTTRLCIAAGAHVFGVDINPVRASLALESGAERCDTTLDTSTGLQVLDWARGLGVDVVLITAGGADSQPLHLAAAASRDRAKIVIVGTLDLHVPREAFYEKELNLVISRSYGPGRYDANFEEKGIPYPAGYVPWTERRNMLEILDLLENGRLSLVGLHETLPFERAPEAYELLGSTSPPVSILLDYGVRDGSDLTVQTQAPAEPRGTSEPYSHLARPLGVSFVGLGNFASSYLLPGVRSHRSVSLQHVITTNPLKADSLRARSGFRMSGADANVGINAKETEVLFIATRHDTHARYVESALLANKAVFVEKPLVLTEREYDRVATALRGTQGRLMIGFNRRFAPATYWSLGALGSNRAGMRVLYRINAGPLPANHWLLDPDVGGGRLVGEGCHFIDLACHVAGTSPLSIEARSLETHAGTPPQSFHIEIVFPNATAGIEYIASGDSSLAKERIEIHRSGTSIVIDDFRSATLYRSGKRTQKKWPGRDKGHRAEVRAFLEAVRTGSPTPIPEEES